MDFCQNNNRMTYSTDINFNRERERRVVFYGRVSTEHEAQLSALQNQMQWYEDQKKYHSNWNVVNRYIDEGITGTQAKKRPAFLQMIEDAKKRKFDLIVTREVCRFARNTVDTLVTTRELKGYGVEVYFVEDNIWTMDGDGELRLSLMATLAQEESRKTSERVRAGQKISRDKGVLYGSGNILGYDRDKVNKTYVINPEQAETVKMIFEMYASGMGEKKIKDELYRLHRKCANGTISWACSKIGRILKNATYKGYKCYLKYYSNNYLEQKQKRNKDPNTYMYVKGDFEPIVSEELWNLCNEKIESKTRRLYTRDGKLIRAGTQNIESTFTKKLKCICGATFAKFKWHVYKNGKRSYGYKCRNALQKGDIKFRKENELDITGACEGRMIADWKLYCMAHKIFSTAWNDRDESVKKALAIYATNKVDDGLIKADKDYEEQIKTLKNRMVNIVNMRADDLIDDDTFIMMKEQCLSKITDVEKERAEYIQNINNTKSKKVLDLSEIKQSLDKKVEFEGDMIPDDIIEKFVDKIVVVSYNHFKWYLNRADEDMTITLAGNKIKDKDYPPAESFIIDYEEAKEFHSKNFYGVRTHQDKWEDLIIEVYY